MQAEFMLPANSNAQSRGWNHSLGSQSNASFRLSPKTPPATQEPDVETGARTVDTRAMGRGPAD